MAVIAKSLQPGITLGSSAGAVVTAPTAVTTIISSAVISNPTSAAVTMTVQIQRSGQGALDLIPARAVLANSTDLAPELNGLVLAAGDEVLAQGEGLVMVVNGNSLS